MAKKLLIINSEQYMEVPFEQQLTIGRDVYNSLSLQDTELSRSHAIIFAQGRKTIVKDLNSRNGVYVNGERVGEQVLVEGDEVILGQTILIFDPPENLDLQQRLSQRGEYLFERRTARSKPPSVEPVTVFTPAQMDAVIDRLFNQPENTSYFTLTNAMSLLRAYYEMGHSRETAELFHLTLERAMDLLGGDHGIIMESDDSKEKLKVRSIVSREDSDSTIEISQQVLRVVLRAKRCVFCPNAGDDNRFSKLAAGPGRKVVSFVAAPIVASDSYFGFMYLHSEDPAVQYDFVALRSLYFLASQLASLLQPHRTHFRHLTFGREDQTPAGIPT